MLEFRILGPLEVVLDDRAVSLGGPKQRATLAILLLNANHIVSVDRLADDLYSGAAPVTAVTQVQRQISELRKILGSDAIETRAPGYILRLSSTQLDLDRFERLVAQGYDLLDLDESGAAATAFVDALALWRGPALADLRDGSFARPAIERLEEMRLVAQEQRIEAMLRLGRHGMVAGELNALVGAHPMRERLYGQLMLALYRSGRQGDALDVYRRAREMLVEQLGIEPTFALRELERAILVQDPHLDLERAIPVRAGALGEPDRTVLVLPSSDQTLDALLTIAAPLVRLPGRELIVARLLPEHGDVAHTSAWLNARRASLAGPVRTAAFTTRNPVEDAIRLAASYDVELILLDVPTPLGVGGVPADLAALFESSPADVGVLSGAMPDGHGAICVPFGGGEHEWAALEVAALLSLAMARPLRLVGMKADSSRVRRDASRLLADASLAVQRTIGVATEPHLVEPTDEALMEAIASAALVVAGISPRWRREGFAGGRRALLAASSTPTILVHRGPRPSGIAPRERHTRFTWSVGN